MAYCVKCGTKIVDGAKFCGECGSKVGEGYNSVSERKEFFDGEKHKCPMCGEEKATTYQRIVGFLTPEKTYSKERKAEFSMRDWMDLNGKSDLE